MHDDIMVAGSKERPPLLAPGESINKKNVKTKLFWEFGKFSSRDGGSIESYYSRFYKMMNEMVRNKLKVDNMQLASEDEDSDLEQAKRDKDMQENLALIAKNFKNIYKPTNNNLITSSNTKNKTVDTSPRSKNDRCFGQFENQRIVIVVGARETV
nr:hypothetical protein [Tanacetum cinerariifolium]